MSAYDATTKQFNAIGYSEVTYDKKFRSLIIKDLDKRHLNNKYGTKFGDDVFYSIMDKMPISEIKSHLKSSTFVPLRAYIGNDIMSTEYGNLVLYAILDEATHKTMFKIVFRVRSVCSMPYTANRIERVHRMELFYNGESIITHEADIDSMYGFGGCFCSSPILETEEQRNIHALQNDLKSWSVSNKINENWRRIEKLSVNKKKMAARKRVFY